MLSPCRPILAWYSTRSVLILLGLYACGGGGGGTEPNEPSSITIDPPSISFTALGQTQQLSPTVEDRQGNPLNVTVSWSSSDPNVATVSSDGLVTAVGPGNAELTASAGSAAADAAVSVVQTPTQMQKVAGDGQVGTPGQAVGIPPAVSVKDANGNGVAGVQVTFEVVSGGGTITGGSATTDADGNARVGSWTLGSAGSNVLRATAAGASISGNPATFTVAGSSLFDISVRFLGSATTAQRQAFADAEARWETLITGDLQNVVLTAAAGECGTESPAINENVDDVLILVTVEAIDGPGNVVGSAGPCFIRLANNLPVLGAMRFDTADLEDLETAGLLSQAIMHEMAHVLGFGSLWPLEGLLADPSLDSNGEVIVGADPHFTGSGAITAFDQIGGAGYSGGKVPVEDTGGEGTADSHWRETIFTNELMTGTINLGQNPLSRVTVASLADMGFTVNENSADNFTLSLAFARTMGSPKVVLRNDLLRVPIKKVDSQGRVMRILRR